MTEFAALCAAVVRDGGFDITAALAVADYLEERGDERGARLRRRVRRFEQRVNDGRQELVSYGRWVDWVKAGCIEKAETQSVRYYFFRLTSVAPGESLPREKVGGSHILVEPGGG